MKFGSKPLRLGLKIASQFQGKLKSYSLFAEAVQGRRGLEIGGPSKPFRSAPIPIYDLVGSLDNCNFARSTIWSDQCDTFTFSPARPSGRNFISDATDLSAIPDKYEFVLSSHNLEHIANPIRALKEWKRVAPTLLLIVPDGRRTFDRFRPVTSVLHMLEDYVRAVGEDDGTHFEEVINLHDIHWGFRGDRSKLERNVRENFRIRSIHHHVFDEMNIKQLLEELGAAVKVVEKAYPHHICVLATW